LKIVEIVIILVPEGDMKQQVLKALANPSRIFYVPYSLAILNFVVQFIVFIVIFVSRLLITGQDTNPLFFLGSVIIVHSFIAIFSKRDPQLGQIISAKIQLFVKKIPGKLAA
jgi:type IV secretory pathway VirB3-like protein